MFEASLLKNHPPLPLCRTIWLASSIWDGRPFVTSSRSLRRKRRKGKPAGCMQSPKAESETEIGREREKGTGIGTKKGIGREMAGIVFLLLDCVSRQLLLPSQERCLWRVDNHSHNCPAMAVVCTAGSRHGNSGTHIVLCTADPRKTGIGAHAPKETDLRDTVLTVKKIGEDSLG